MVPSVAVLMALAALSSPDGIDTTGTRARLVVSGPAHCLTREDLARRVKARAPRVDFTDDAPIVAAVAVTAYSPDAQIVQLDFLRPGEGLRPRVLKTGTCAEAADAVALILAVTLDPSSQGLPPNRGPDQPPASSEVTPVPGASPVAGLAPSTASSGATSAPSPPTTSSRGPRTAVPAKHAAVVKGAPPAPPPVERPGPESATPAPTVTTAPASRVTRQAPHELALGATADTMFGVAPQLMPGFSLFAMLEATSDGAWAPAIAVRWTHVWRTGLAEPFGAASFTLDAGTVDACPLRWRWSRLALRPCASLLVGRLATHGSGTSDDSGAARPFSTAGLSLQARLGRTVELSARLGLGVALVRDWYAFGDQVFYRTGLLTTSASLGAGFHWP